MTIDEKIGFIESRVYLISDEYAEYVIVLISCYGYARSWSVEDNQLLILMEKEIDKAYVFFRDSYEIIDTEIVTKIKELVYIGE